MNEELIQHPITLRNSELTNASLEPIIRNSSPNPTLIMGNNSRENINEDLIISVLNENRNEKNNKKETYKNFPKLISKNSSRSHVAGSSISGQVDTHSINYEGEVITPISNTNDISFTTTHDGIEPIITNDEEYINKQNILTHRRKLAKSSSNSYLFKSNSNDTLPDERINLLPKH